MNSPNQSSRDLRKTLRAYVSTAQHNAEKLQRFHDQELQFITANGLNELIESIYVDYKQNFQLDHVSLLLVDEEFEIRHILNTMQIDSEKSGLLFSDVNIEQEHFAGGVHPLLCEMNEPLPAIFFSNLADHINSAAVLPLLRGNRIIGTLNIGSRDSKRFIPGSATDFLEHLATILAVCIENAINLEKVRLLGLIDPLTGVHNRRYFEQRLHEEAGNVLRHKNDLAFLIIDLDHFKAINDCCGHPVGDRVLQEVSTLIRMQLRLSDVLARFGGEEFVVLISGTDKQTVLDIAERIRTSITAHDDFCKMSLPNPVSVSIGVCMLPSELQQDDIGRVSQQLLQRADEALYHSKQQGRNQTTCFDY
jgi:diguanylate cyclase (GGDEF)-like protein